MEIATVMGNDAAKVPSCRLVICEVETSESCVQMLISFAPRRVVFVKDEQVGRQRGSAVAPTQGAGENHEQTVSKPSGSPLKK